MKRERCHSCLFPARHAIGWGLQTGMVFYFCDRCWLTQLARLSRLMEWRSNRPVLEVISR